MSKRHGSVRAAAAGGEAQAWLKEPAHSVPGQPRSAGQRCPCRGLLPQAHTRRLGGSAGRALRAKQGMDLSNVQIADRLCPKDGKLKSGLNGSKVGVLPLHSLMTVEEVSATKFTGQIP